MTWWLVLAGFALGALGALGHLAVAWQRAVWARERGAAAVLVTFPLGLLAPALAVVLAAQLAPSAAWATPLGMLAARFAVLARRARR